MSIDPHQEAPQAAGSWPVETGPESDARAWTAVVLTAEGAEQVLQCRPEEIWNWCLARLAKLGQLQPGHARLLVLRHWTPRCIEDAIEQARELLRQMHCPLEERQATWEYLSGECLARMALDLPMEHPGARRQPVDLQVV